MMNKLLLCAMLILAAGCSKDDEPTNQNDQLVGTVWHQDINEYRAYTFYFAINGKCTESWKTSVGSGTLDLQRTFEYKAPNITIISPSGSVVYSGTVDGNKMKLKASNPEKGELLLTKVR